MSNNRSDIIAVKTFFKNLSQLGRQSAQERYLGYSNIIKVLKNYPDDLADIWGTVSEMAAKKLNHNGINCDDFSFLKNATNHPYFPNAFSKQYASVAEQVADLIGERKAAEQYRNMRKQCRGRFVGGGFGITGALGGMAMAGIANAITGVGHSVFNGASGLATNVQIEMKLKEIYNSRAVQNKFCDAVAEDIFGMRYFFLDCFDLPYA